MPTMNMKPTAEAAGMLLLFSVFALVEGIIRTTTHSRPSVETDYFDDADGTILPVVVFLAAGVAEVVFGLGGIFVALFVIMFDSGSPSVTMMFAFVQAVLGWFVFAVFVIVAPILKSLEAEALPDVPLTQNENRLLILLGNLMGSFAFCFALQGGQFIMIMRLMAAQRGRVVVSSRNVLRTLVWSGNQIVAAGSTLFVGILLFVKDVDYSTTAPIVAAPPHVVWFPLLSIVTGGIMFVYGCTGVFAAFNRSLATALMPFLFIVTTVAMMANFAFVFGIVPGLAPPIPGSAQHVVLVLAVTILPVFHAWKAHHPEDISEEDDDVNVHTGRPPMEMAPQARAPRESRRKPRHSVRDDLDEGVA